METYEKIILWAISILFIGLVIIVIISTVHNKSHWDNLEKKCSQYSEKIISEIPISCLEFFNPTNK